MCSELPTIDNGMISYSPDSGGPDYDLDTVATYSCNDGFDLVGDSVRVCEAVGNSVMGMFNGSTPVCNRGVVMVMFVQQEYTVFEDDGSVSIEITTDRPVLYPFTVRIVGGEETQTFVSSYSFDGFVVLFLLLFLVIFIPTPFLFRAY